MSDTSVGTLSLFTHQVWITMTCCTTKIGSLNIEGKEEPQIQTSELWH